MDIKTHDNFTVEQLQKCPYRFLQKKAKAKGLPSNVKKVHLIQLLYTKLYGTSEELERLVHWVKNERQILIESRKSNTKTSNNLQSTEISSTYRVATSPGITNTPHRSTYQYRPHPESVCQKKMQVNSASNRILRNRSCLTRRNKRLESIRSCNRGGKSSIIKTNLTLEYSSVLPSAKRRRTLSGIDPITQSTNAAKATFELLQSELGICHGDEMGINAVVDKSTNNWEASTTGIGLELQNVTKVTSKTYANDYIPTVCNALSTDRTNYVDKECGNDAIVPVKSARNTPQNTMVSSETFTYYNRDQSYASSTIQNTQSTNNEIIEYGTVACVPVKSTDSTLQDTIVTSNTYDHDHRQYSPTIYTATIVDQNNYGDTEYSSQNNTPAQTGLDLVNYYVDHLPGTQDVYGNINNIEQTNVTTPIYLSIDQNPLLLPVLSYSGQAYQRTEMLESLYNFKNSFVVNAPLPSVTTTVNTTCVFSIYVTATASHADY